MYRLKCLLSLFIFQLSLLSISLPVLAFQNSYNTPLEITSAFPKSYFINEQGKADGLAIELVNAILKNANVNISYKVMSS